MKNVAGLVGGLNCTKVGRREVYTKTFNGETKVADETPFFGFDIENVSKLT